MRRFIVNFVYLWAVIDIRLPIVSSLTNNATEIQSTIQSLNYSLSMMRWEIVQKVNDQMGNSSIAQKDIHKTRWLMAVDANFTGAYHYPIYLCSLFQRPSKILLVNLCNESACFSFSAGKLMVIYPTWSLKLELTSRTSIIKCMTVVY